VLRIEVTVDDDQDKARFLEADLYKLVDVLLVEKKDFIEETARPGSKDGHF
jgi:hypothetical protein